MPLDWNSTDFVQSERRVSIAIARIPARVPITDPRYGGAIIINPGIRDLSFRPRSQSVDPLIANMFKPTQADLAQVVSTFSRVSVIY